MAAVVSTQDAVLTRRPHACAPPCQFWDHAYLDTREPNPVYTNPFYLLRRPTAPGLSSQLSLAAAFTSSAVKWWHKVVSGALEPDRDGGAPMCMTQFGPTFGTARIPARGTDVLAFSGRSRHIAVMHRGHIFSVDVLTDAGTPLAPADIERQLEFIVDGCVRACARACMRACVRACVVSSFVYTPRDPRPMARHPNLTPGRPAALHPPPALHGG
jgi:hypothetical protein